MDFQRKRSLDQSSSVRVKYSPARKTRSLNNPQLRSERLQFILSLFKESPHLADILTSRRPDSIRQVNLEWEKITDKVNAKYGKKLEILTAAQVKKDAMYIKKREEGSYNNIKNVVIKEEAKNQEYPRIPTPGHAGISPSKSNEQIHISFTGRKGVSESENEYPYTVSQTSLTEDHQAQLIKFLSGRINDKPVNPIAIPKSAPIEKRMVVAPPVRRESTGSSVGSNASVNRKMAKERALFITDQVDFNMQRLSLSASSRSATVNNERSNMWIKIVQTANEKFTDELSPIGVEQAKKTFANMKMRERHQAEEEIAAMFDGPPQPKPNGRMSSAPSDIPRVKAKSTEFRIPKLNGSSNQQKKRQNGEIEQLKKQLKEQEEEIKSLRKKIVEQAVDYRDRMNSILEMVKSAINTKVSEDIAKLLSY